MEAFVFVIKIGWLLERKKSLTQNALETLYAVMFCNQLNGLCNGLQVTGFLGNSYYVQVYVRAEQTNASCLLTMSDSLMKSHNIYMLEWGQQENH